MKINILIIVLIVVWFICGYLGFVLDMITKGRRKVNENDGNDLPFHIVFGIFTLLFYSCIFINQRLLVLTDNILYKINHKK